MYETGLLEDLEGKQGYFFLGSKSVHGRFCNVNFIWCSAHIMA